MVQLIVNSSDSSQQHRHSLRDEAMIRIGRSSRNQCSVPWDRMISREHAVIRRRDGCVEIRCLASGRNSIHFQGKSGRSFRLSVGDEFRIGSTLFRVDGASNSCTLSSQITSRLLVLMFTDLVDSSTMTRELGDVDYVRFVAKPHNKLFQKLLLQFPSAEENNYTGDGFLATFDRVSDAVHLALLFHHGLQMFPWKRLVPSVRIGIHVGETTMFSGSNTKNKLLSSHATNICARLMSLGCGGQTLLTRSAFDSARQYLRNGATVGSDSKTELRWTTHGHYAFKGSSEPMEVFEVGMDGVAPLTAPEDSEKAHRVAAEHEQQPWNGNTSTGRNRPTTARPSSVFISEFASDSIGLPTMVSHGNETGSCQEYLRSG